MESQNFCSYKGKGQTDEKSKLSPLMGFEPTKCKVTVIRKPTALTNNLIIREIALRQTRQFHSQIHETNFRKNFLS